MMKLKAENSNTKGALSYEIKRRYLMEEAIKKNSGLDIIYYFLTSPGSGVESVKGKNFFLLSLFTATLSVLSSFAGDNLILFTASFPESLSLSFLFKLLFFYFFLFSAALIYNFIAELLGRREKATMLLVLLGLSFLPGIFNAPLALVCSGVNLKGAYGILKLIIILWTIGLQVFCLRKFYDFSMFRAIMVYITPFLLIFFLMFSLLIIILTFFTLDLARIFM